MLKGRYVREQYASKSFPNLPLDDGVNEVIEYTAQKCNATQTEPEQHP